MEEAVFGIFPETRDYYIRTRNEASAAADPAATYACSLRYGDPSRLPIDRPNPITTSTRYRSQERGLILEVLGIGAGVPTLLEISTATAAVGMDPFIRVYSPGGIGLIAEGDGAVSAILPGELFPYVVAVHNGFDNHFVHESPAFELDIRLTPQ